MKSAKEARVSTESDTAKINARPLLARRAIIKAAVGTVPTILTLQSGAALARSSNMISASTDPTDAAGRTLCLDQRFAIMADGGDLADVGEPPYLHVTAINERDYFGEPNRGSTPMAEEEMCTDGETAYYQNFGWRQVDVPKGMLVSATAIASFSNVDITEI